MSPAWVWPSQLTRFPFRWEEEKLKPSSEILIQLACYQFDATTKDLWRLINMLMLRQKSEQNAHLDKAWQQSVALPWKPQKAIN